MIGQLDIYPVAEMKPAVKDFHHPYKPYDIQSELMNFLYQCIAERKIGILESPTGPFSLGISSWLARLTSVTRNCTLNYFISHTSSSLHWFFHFVDTTLVS